MVVERADERAVDDDAREERRQRCAIPLERPP